MSQPTPTTTPPPGLLRLGHIHWHVHIPVAHVVLGLVLVAVAAALIIGARTAGSQRDKKRDKLVAHAVGIVASLAPKGSGVRKADHAWRNKPVAWEGNKPTRISFHHEPHAGIAAIIDQIGPALAPLLGNGRAAWTAERQVITWRAEPPAPTLPKEVVRPDLVIEAGVPKGAYGFGQAVAMPVWWAPLIGSAPHMLIGAKSGAGKTQFLTTVIISAIAEGTSAIILDGKEFGLMDLCEYPGVERYCNTAAGFAAAIQAINAENDRRKRQVWDSKDRRTAEKLPPLMLVIDEVADVLAELDKETAALLERIVRTGRETRIQVMLACLYPKGEAEGLTTRARGSLGCRVMLGHNEEVALHTMIFGRKAPDPSLDTPGRGVMRTTGGGFVEFQTWVSDPRQCRPAVAPAPVLGGARGGISAGQTPVIGPVGTPLAPPVVAPVGADFRGADSPVDRPVSGEDSPADSPPEAPPKRRTNGTQAPITLGQIARIRALHIELMPHRAIAREVGVSPPTVTKWADPTRPLPSELAD
jgi:hypothetical protein